MQQEQPTPILPTTPEPAPKSHQHDGWRAAASTIGIILAAILVAIFVMFFIFRSYQVDGPSMEPTLQNNDRLIIWKLPRTIARVTGHTYIPNRGDIIVFAEPGLTTDDGSTKQLIKRVIGLPGDRVVIKNGQVAVYNKEHPQGFNPDTTMPYGHGLNLRIDPDENVDETIQKDEVFAMGDNRNNSLDSRVFGPVQANNIVGKLVLRIFPLESAKTF